MAAHAGRRRSPQYSPPAPPVEAAQLEWSPRGRRPGHGWLAVAAVVDAGEWWSAGGYQVVREFQKGYYWGGRIVWAGRQEEWGGGGCEEGGK